MSNVRSNAETFKSVWNFVPDQFRQTFVSPWEQYRDRIGQPFTVLGKLVENEGEDEVVLYRIRFQDGKEIQAWPEEVCIEDKGYIE